MRDFICYCFEYTDEDIKKDFIAHGRSLIMEKIMAEKKMGTCECTTKNPSGKWCLPDVRQVVDKLKGKDPSAMFGNMISDRKDPG